MFPCFRWRGSFTMQVLHMLPSSVFSFSAKVVSIYRHGRGHWMGTGYVVNWRGRGRITILRFTGCVVWSVVVFGSVIRPRLIPRLFPRAISASVLLYHFQCILSLSRYWRSYTIHDSGPVLVSSTDQLPSACPAATPIHHFPTPSLATSFWLVPSWISKPLSLKLTQSMSHI